MAAQALTEAVYFILLSLLTPMHGYGIMKNAEQLSNGRAKLGAGTLYGAINALLDKGWIVPLPGEADGRRKQYVITEAGVHALQDELQRLSELYRCGMELMGGKNDEENLS